MISKQQRAELKAAEQEMTSRINSFPGLYMAIGSLRDRLRENPETADTETIKTIETILQYRKHQKESKAFFLYRDLAEVLVEVIIRTKDKNVRKSGLQIYSKALQKMSGDALMATAEAAGGLSFSMSPPEFKDTDISSIPTCTTEDLLKSGNISLSGNLNHIGRSLVFETEDSRLFVMKAAKPDDNLQNLNRECLYMDYLKKFFRTEQYFNIPEPIMPGTHYLASVKGNDYPGGSNKGSDFLCIAFTASRDYFIYPNEQTENTEIDETAFLEMITRNSRLLGELAGAGIVHTAPVPLFHNRTQQGRRNDGGLYLWEKCGRLDRWLESCRFPNFGKSGIRDFEHFIRMDKNSTRLYKQIGSHLLSFFLVAGSFFRNIGKDGADLSTVGCSGIGPDGKPTDARELFNKKLFCRVVENIVTRYYKGFSGAEIPENLLNGTEKLTDRMINEMGIDTYMEEILRAPDQKNMTRKSFIDFLVERGVPIEKAENTEPGENDITTMTGPHLGSFNRKFSLPELTEFIAGTAAACLVGRYTMETIDKK